MAGDGDGPSVLVPVMDGTGTTVALHGDMTPDASLRPLGLHIDGLSLTVVTLRDGSLFHRLPGCDAWRFLFFFHWYRLDFHGIGEILEDHLRIFLHGNAVGVTALVLAADQQCQCQHRKR